MLVKISIFFNKPQIWYFKIPTKFCTNCRKDYIEKFGWKRIITVALSIWKFALRSAVLETFLILGFPIDPHVKISKCHKIFKTWPIAKKSNSLYSTMLANVLIKFRFDISSAIWYCVNKTFKVP